VVNFVDNLRTQAGWLAYAIHSDVWYGHGKEPMGSTCLLSVST